MAGVLTLWASPRCFRPASAERRGVRKLTDTISVLDGGGSNVVAFRLPMASLLVDTGAPGNGDR
jgi:hypothetical protein